MRAVFSLCFFLLLTTFIFGQDLILTPIAETVCSPGVVNKSPGKGLQLQYGINPQIKLRSENFSEEDDSQSGVNKRYTIKLKAPILNKKKFKLLVGWNYYGEEYDFDHSGEAGSSILGNIDDKNLKSSRLSLYMIKPINHKYYVAVKAVAAYNGDYSGALNFDSRYASYDVATIFGVKPRANLEWGVGIIARKNFMNGFPVLPFAMYNHTFNSKWGIESTLPVNVKVRYNIDDKSLLMFGPQFESRSYSIDVFNANKNQESIYTMRRSELRFELNYQKNLSSWFWMDVSAGYAKNFRTEFIMDNPGSQDPGILSATPSSGPYFKVGIFLSPPRGKFK